MDAIVYTSNTGSTRRYAGLLAEKTGLSVYSLEEAKKALPGESEILYLGWLMAGSVKGYTAAAKRFRVRAVIGVGMGAPGSQMEEVRKKNAVPEKTPVFILQGNFRLKELHGVYKMMMKVMLRAFQNKQNRTPEENEMLRSLLSEEDKVSPEALKSVLDWYEKTL